MKLSKVCFRCEGVGIVSSRARYSWTPNRPQPEEYECPECDGTGAVPTAAGHEVLKFLISKHHLWHRKECRDCSDMSAL